MIIIHFHKCIFSSVQSLSRVWLFVTPWIAACQASLSITNSQSSLKLMSIESVMLSSHLILSSSSPPAPNPSQHQSLFLLFSWSGQSIGVSTLASVLPMNTQAWFPLEWTRWISLQSKGLSSLLQHHGSKASILWCSALQSSFHIHTWRLEKS